MKQKDLNDLCTVISIYSQCNSLYETFQQAKYDIPEDLKSDFDCIYYNLKDFIVDIGNYISYKEDITNSVKTNKDNKL